MICPILEIGWMQTKVGEKGVSSDCLKEDCAWWEQKIGKCSILRIWIALQDIHEVLHDIAKTLPTGKGMTL